MGKKQGSTLGNAVIKHRRRLHRGRSDQEFSMRHVADVNDGYDWAKLNLNSITEQSNLEEFLTTAELAGTEFQAEKLNITYVNKSLTHGLLTPEEKREILNLQKEHEKLLRIPRRPAWDRSMLPEELLRLEQDTFLNWRKRLNELEAIEGIILTPFEKNLEFWRQLWRVIERSDVVVQIVDARDPLLFWCDDLEKYVSEIDKNKLSLILINKADFLSYKQRCAWADYLIKKGIKVVFFSALQELEAINESESENSDSDCETKSESTDHEEPEKTSINIRQNASIDVDDNARIYSRTELIEYFKTVHVGVKVNNEYTTIGLVGYPNVGKSSTINSLLRAKKTSVSVTPGKTKHFQTLFVDEDLCLCDCPGLVMPMFVSTKADMVVSGILPIDQMRDHIGPINLQIASRFPRYIFEEKYGIILPKPLEEEDPNRQPSAEELLNSYAFMRGFMTQRGLPDAARGARYIVKDYVSGKLLHCNAPPGESVDVFHEFPPPKYDGHKAITNVKEIIACQPGKSSSKDLDRKFFVKASVGVHYKNENSTNQAASTSETKPWKKHNNRKKREKLRRTYVDQQ